jgi:hypothetical protein
MVAVYLSTSRNVGSSEWYLAVLSVLQVASAQVMLYINSCDHEPQENDSFVLCTQFNSTWHNHFQNTGTVLWKKTGLCIFIISNIFMCSVTHKQTCTLLSEFSLLVWFSFLYAHNAANLQTCFIPKVLNLIQRGFNFPELMRTQQRK